MLADRVPQFDEVFNVRGRWDRNTDTQGLGVPNTIFTTTSHDVHRARRAPLNQFFSRRRIAALEPNIREQVDKLVARLALFAGTGEAVKMHMAYAALTMDTIGVYALGTNFANLDQDNFNETYHSIVEGMGPIYHLHKQLPWIMRLFDAIPADWIRGFDPGIAGFKDLQRHCYERVHSLKMSEDNPSSKYDSSQDKTSVFHALLEDPALPTAEKATPRLGEEAMAVMAAGTSTTAQTLTFMTFHLCKQPALKAALRAEIAACPGPRPIPLQKLEQLPLLTGIVKEALRLGFPGTSKTSRSSPDNTVLYPTMTSAGSQGSYRNEDHETARKQYALPPGTWLSMSIWFLQRNERVFANPHAFDPYRWVRATEDERRRLDKYWIPFARGTRNCLGMT